MNVLGIKQCHVFQDSTALFFCTLSSFITMDWQHYTLLQKDMLVDVAVLPTALVTHYMEAVVCHTLQLG